MLVLGHRIWDRPPGVWKDKRPDLSFRVHAVLHGVL